MNNQKRNFTNGKAIGSLIIGILSILGFFLMKDGTILSVAGLLLGIMGLREAKKLKQNGQGHAKAGMICNGLASIFLFT